MVPVLLSHSCRNVVAHTPYVDLAPIFAEAVAQLLKDPFSPGDDVQTGMESMQIHGLIRRCTPEANESQPCTAKLHRAREIRAPLFVIHDGGRLKGDLTKRIYVDLSRLWLEARYNNFEQLAATAASRTSVHRLNGMLDERAAPDEQESAAAIAIPMRSLLRFRRKRPRLDDDSLVPTRYFGLCLHHQIPLKRFKRYRRLP